MNKSSGYHKAVENLVTMEPNVHFAREEPLWDPEGVEKRPRDVEEAHEDEPAKARFCDGPLPPVLHGVVSGGRYAGQSEHDEDEGPVGPVPRRPELVPQTDHHRQDAQHYHHRHVQHLQWKGVLHFLS